MAHKFYVDLQGPPVDAAWLNDVDNLTYGLLGTGGAASTTTAEILTALGIANYAGYPATAAEIAAGIVPTYLFYLPGVTLRYGAKGDGTTDDTTALTKALASGAIVNGLGLTYATTAQLTMPTGTTICFATIQMADTDYLALAYNSDCTIQKVKVLGTNRTNQYPGAQRGIGEATFNSTNVTVVARVEGCNSCVDCEGTSDSRFDIFVLNASGQPGVSEGYGLLMYLGANRNTVHINAKGCARHACYVSSGSSQNHIVCHSSGTKTQAAVQINSTKSEGLCTGNYFTGSSYGDYSGVVFFQDVGGTDTGGAVQDNIAEGFEVFALPAAIGAFVANGGPAYQMSFGNAGATPSTGNRFVNCRALGQFNSTTQGVVEIAAGWNSHIDDLFVRAVCLNTLTAAINVAALAGGVTRIRGLDMDLLTSSTSIVGVQVFTNTGLWQLDDANIVMPGATKLFPSGSSAQFRRGRQAIGASGLTAGTVTVPYSSITASCEVILSRGNAAGTLGHLAVAVTPGTGFIINSSSITDTSTINWEIVESSP